MAMFSSEPSILDKIEDIFAEKKSFFVFETCGDRPIYPTSMAKNRLGNSMNPLRGEPHMGPGYYDIESKTNMIAVMNKIPRSNLGYVLGTKTAPRFQEFSDRSKMDNFKPPIEKPIGVQTKFWAGQNKVPFQNSTIRFKSLNYTNEACPGPGTYNSTYPGCKRVRYHGGFGGTPNDLPDVSLKSTICRNTEKLNSTKEEKKYQRRLAYLKLYYD